MMTMLYQGAVTPHLVSSTGLMFDEHCDQALYFI